MYSQYVEILKQVPKHKFIFKECLNTINIVLLGEALLWIFLGCILASIFSFSIIDKTEEFFFKLCFFISLCTILGGISFFIYQCNSIYKNIQYKNVESYISENTTIKGKHLYVLEDDKKTMEALKHERDVLLYDQNKHIINANAFPSKVSDKEYNHAIANGKNIDKLTLVGNKETALSSLINSKKLKEMSNILSVEEKGNKTIIYYVDKK